MKNKFKLVLLIAVLILISWYYWTSNLKHYDTKISLLRKYNYVHQDYLLQPINTLRVCNQNSYLLIIVTSYVGHVELRKAHRIAMSTKFLNSMNASRVFLIAKIPERETTLVQAAIDDENKIYGDILQGSFEEHYRNLIYKNLMGLRWASTECYNSTFILKVDDDTVFNLKKTYQVLSQLNFPKIDRENLLLGYILRNMTPQRTKDEKWYVSQDEYKRTEYPQYLSGWYYITTPKMARRLVEEAANHPLFWIDDVFITGIVAEALNIPLQELPKGFWMDYYELVECCITNMIKKNIKCDYAVGPNGGRDNLIVEFNRALQICSRRRECTNNDMKPPCVVWKNREIFSEGKGEVEVIKFRK